MVSESFLGPYGFYEAIDFTPQRLKDGKPSTVIPVFMAHHHGMSLLALGQTVLGPKMQGRFLEQSRLPGRDATASETIPKTYVLLHPFSREALASRRMLTKPVDLLMRVFTNPNPPIPEVHLLSNGRYHVMVFDCRKRDSPLNDQR